ncbi:MAG: hypothetical protein M3Z66_16995 [Chloroflexota bacterium]|nr:hypothetical protein [Chloroflexota bacterium]
MKLAPAFLVGSLLFWATCASAMQSSPPAPSWLVTVSRNVATRNGEELPLWGKFVATTRRAAQHLIGVRNTSDQPVYDVVLRGQFTQASPYKPQKPIPPTGTVITVTVGTTSHRILDYHLGSGIPAIASLGYVRTLSLSNNSLRPPSIPPRQLVARYFADLNAHRWYPGYLLEATCQADFTLPNGPGAPVGAGGFPARPALGPHLYNRSAGLRAARVTDIHPFHDAILARNHFLGFDVGVWLKFVYPPVSSGYAGNNERPSGHHVVKMILHRCDGRWGIDSGWLGSGGPWNWT